ncbi:MAG: HAD family phosphatase [Rikenellaceae bacterium]|nr:HAD family phosphatase [Rikenellaceae bacterium]
MKNIVFDLGRVVFAQNPNKSSEEYKRFFSYVAQSPMPQFWVDYDMGVSSFDKVVSDLSAYRGVEEDYTRSMILASISRQETIVATEALIQDLKRAGYKLYVLSNMSREFIDFLRKQPVYSNFDGEVVSCEEGVVKPMPSIYEILIKRYNLDVAQTMFIDDRIENVEVAKQFGITPFHFDRDDTEGSCAKLRKMLL